MIITLSAKKAQERISAPLNTFSNGHKTQIAIARAILKNAPILIIDEGTSNLDLITENKIHDTLESIMDNKTVVIITHRIYTLSKMDRIVIFNKGKIIEDGKHEDMIKSKNSIYEKLWLTQKKYK